MFICETLAFFNWDDIWKLITYMQWVNQTMVIERNRLMFSDGEKIYICKSALFSINVYLLFYKTSQDKEEFIWFKHECFAACTFVVYGRRRTKVFLASQQGYQTGHFKVSNLTAFDMKWTQLRNNENKTLNSKTAE